MNSILTLLNKYVSMSILSKDSLETVLNKVAIAQTRALDRLTLTIPFQEMLSYYEAQLLQDVLTLPNGLLMTMSIPLASRRNVLTTYQALRYLFHSRMMLMLSNGKSRQNISQSRKMDARPLSLPGDR